MQVNLKVELLRYTPEPEELVAAAAKLCYSPSEIKDIMENLTKENVEKFINRLASYGHQSPFEHVSFTFGIEGISRALSHQLVRHRIASYSQKSQRYVGEEDFDYIIPPEIEKYPDLKEVFEHAMTQDKEAYHKLAYGLMNMYMLEYLKESDPEFYREYMEMQEKFSFDLTQYAHEMFRQKTPKDLYQKFQKIAFENARYVLPNACETKLVMTMNARSLLHFFDLRCCERAQDEIRALAKEMLRLVKPIAPNLFKFAGPSCVGDLCPEGKMSCGKAKEIREEFLSI